MIFTILVSNGWYKGTLFVSNGRKKERRINENKHRIYFIEYDAWY